MYRITRALWSAGGEGVAQAGLDEDGAAQGEEGRARNLRAAIGEVLDEEVRG